MPKYFFNIIDGKFLADTEGTECRDMAEVRSLAIETAGAMLKEAGDRHADSLWQMIVSDSNNQTVLKIHFSVERIT